MAALSTSGAQATTLAVGVLDVDRDGDEDLLLRSGVVYADITRHLYEHHPARSGGVGRLQLHGPAGSAFVLAASGATFDQPFGNGRLLIDPGQMGWVYSGVLPVNPPSLGFDLNVPTGLDGATIHWQAAFLPGVEMTGRVTTVIRDW